FLSSDETEIKVLFQMQENVGIIILTFNALQKWHVTYLKLAMPFFRWLHTYISVNIEIAEIILLGILVIQPVQD
ncbi:hypothetical protein EZS27_033203, partial [termite gut metagenome]